MTTTTADVEAYAARVRTALADLPAADRADLLADLEDHLTEVADEGDLDELLGAPEAYAAELRSSAGLAPAEPDRPGRDQVLHRWLDETRAFLPQLRPGWWVARAVVLATMLTTFLGAGVAAWLLLAVLLVPGSVVFGRWVEADRGRRWLGIGADAAVALALLTVLGTATSDSDAGIVEQGVVAPGGLDGVTNLYPYDKAGRPLTDVLLYDQDGNPVELRAGTDADGNEIGRIPRLTTDGRVVPNLYPQDQTVTVYPTDDAAGAPVVRRPSPPSISPPALQPR